MSSVTISPLSIYTIFTPAHLYGYVQYPNDTSKFATLASQVDQSVGQQWTIQPIEGSTTGAYSIRSHLTGAYVTWKYTDTPGLEFIGFQADPDEWWLRPADTEYHHICNELSCDYIWAPYELVGGTADRHEIILSPRANATGVDTRWKLSVAATVTPPAGASPTAITNPVSTSAAGANTEDLNNLKKCAPCGKVACTFEPSGIPSPPAVYSVIGQPLSNCNPAPGSASNESIKTTLGGTFELARSFSVQVTAGVSFGLGVAGPSVSASTSITEGVEEKVTRTQSIEVPIAPGRIGALVAKVMYRTTPGNVKIDDRTFAFMSVQPGEVTGYDVLYANCGSNFEAFTLPRTDCNLGSSATNPMSESLVSAWRMWIWIEMVVMLLGAAGAAW
ncbi:hypothetical protein D9611_002110 [Ephemerocybe angulata]|uniref:Uncharacterized protein n=1 Tax=Ephemerocybe angulata TaxID=980116 RepID=A0A8H5FM51_9AGAR|nr:hypothetical protein D9611_002110 [Tulosesus angulatus]